MLDSLALGVFINWIFSLETNKSMWTNNNNIQIWNKNERKNTHESYRKEYKVTTYEVSWTPTMHNMLLKLRGRLEKKKKISLKNNKRKSFLFRSFLCLSLFGFFFHFFKIYEESDKRWALATSDKNVYESVFFFFINGNFSETSTHCFHQIITKLIWVQTANGTGNVEHGSMPLM